MTAGRRRLRTLLVTLPGALALAACNSPNDAGHRIYGYVDASGREVIAPQYLAALPFHEGLAAVRIAEGWGYVDTTGRWVIRPAYVAAGSFSSGRAVVFNVNGLAGYVDHDGRMVIEPRYLTASTFIGDRAFVSPDKERSQVIDREGRVVAELAPAEFSLTDAIEGQPTNFWQLEILYGLERDTAAVQAEGLVPLTGIDGSGYFYPDGRPVTGAIYEDALVFIDGRALVTTNGKRGFIDRAERCVIPPTYDEALPRFSRERTLAVHDGRAWLVDMQGQDVANLGVWPWPTLRDHEGFDDLSNFAGYDDFFADGLIPWQQDGRWGYVGLDGRWVIAPQFEVAQPFHAGRASVQVAGRGRLIDVQGRQVASMPHGWWIAPSGGARFQVGDGRRWGFSDPNGRVPAVLPYATNRITFAGQTFADARPLKFSEGLAVVSRIAPHRWHVVTADGRELATGRYDWVYDAGDGLYAVAVDQRWALADARLRPLSGARFNESPFVFWGSDSAGSVKGGDTDTVTQDGRLGCVNRSGRWRALPANVAYADCASPTMVARSESSDLQGLLSDLGQWIVPPQFVMIQRLEGTATGCFSLTVDGWSDTAVGRIACVDKGKVRYSEPRQFRCRLSEACFLHDAPGWRRVDLPSLQVTGPSYAEIGDAGRSQIAVRLGERWGLMTTSGRMTLPAEYDKITWLPDDAGKWRSALSVQRESLWGLVAEDGREILPVRYEAVQRLADDLFAVREASGWGVVRDHGKVVVAPAFDEIVALRGDLLLAKSGGAMRLDTLSGQQVIDASTPWLQRIYRLSDFSERLWAAFTLDRDLYVIDKQTHVVRRLDPPPGRIWVLPGRMGSSHDDFSEFATGGFSGYLEVRPPGASVDLQRVKLNAVVIDVNGQPLPWLFDSDDSAGPIAPNRYIVYLHGKCGVIDDRGRWSVPIEHDHCKKTERGLVIVGDEDYAAAAARR